jgi:16S rRNA (guanine966-N2)-methyltransferase
MIHRARDVAGQGCDVDHAGMAASGVRVTGGQLRGRRLRAPRDGVRPSSDRVRESLFARLDDLEGAAVLDLYAGTGVLGVEAVSRGAARLVCVERAPKVLATLQRNLTDLGLGDRARVIADDAPRAVRRLGEAGERFDLVFLDPPYAGEELERALEAVSGSGVLSAHGRVVAEHSRRHPVPTVDGLVAVDARRYGDTIITQLEAAEPGATGGASDR